jgi:hypothetical protein
MGGKSKSTTTQQSQFSPSAERLMGLQADVASSIAPGLQNFVLGILGGDQSKAAGFTKSAVGPAEDATRRAINTILARTPPGGMQQELVAKAEQEGGLNIAGQQSDISKLALQMASALFGYQPPSTGTTSTQTQKQPVSMGLNLGPLSLAF